LVVPLYGSGTGDSEALFDVDRIIAQDFAVMCNV
jgi:hypothetical protein